MKTVVVDQGLKDKYEARKKELEEANKDPK